MRCILSECQLYKTVHSLFHDLYELYKNRLNRVALKVISFAKSNRHKDFKLIQPPNLSTLNKGSSEHIYGLFRQSLNGTGTGSGNLTNIMPIVSHCNGTGSGTRTIETH